MSIRIQIAVGPVLVAEAIVENLRAADDIFAHWSQARYSKGLPMGGAVTCLASVPRTWDVPVGSPIRTICDLCWGDDDVQRSERIRICQNAYWEGNVCAACRSQAPICPECQRALRTDIDGIKTCPLQLQHDEEESRERR